MFAFEQTESEDETFDTICHLRDAAESMEIDTTALAFGLSADLETEQLQTIREQLESALAKSLAETERLKIPPCHIGPYGGGICTICGKPQP